MLIYTYCRQCLVILFVKQKNCHAVIDHVSKCVSSSRHLGAVTFNLQSETEFVPGIKYTIASFSAVERCAYCQIRTKGFIYVH